MSSKTTNFNLHKIDLTDAPPDITVLNQNWDTIDSELKKMGGLTTLIGLTSIGLTQGQETIIDIANALPLNSIFQMAITSTHNTAEYPYQTGTLTAVKVLSSRVTFEYVDNNGDHYSGTVRGSGSSAEWLGWKVNSVSYGTADLTAGTSTLATGKLHFVYE